MWLSSVHPLSTGFARRTSDTNESSTWGADHSTGSERVGRSARAIANRFEVEAEFGKFQGSPIAAGRERRDMPDGMSPVSGSRVPIGVPMWSGLLIMNRP